MKAATRRNMEKWYEKFLKVQETLKGNPDIQSEVGVIALNKEDYSYTLRVFVFEGQKIKAHYDVTVSTWWDGHMGEQDRKKWAKIKRIVYGR